MGEEEHMPEQSAECIHQRRSTRPLLLLLSGVLLLLCGSQGFAGPIPSPSLRILADDLTTTRFGESLTMQGDIAIIGAPGDSENGTLSGAAYAYFRQPDGSWMQEAKLTPADAATDDLFGFSVDILNDLVIIGAYRDNDNGADSGSAYVFRRENDGTWIEEAKLVPLDGSTLDRFGFSVGIGVGFEGITACVGAYLDDAAGPDSGSVYIFERDFDGTWDETDKFQGIDTGMADSFGWSVAVDGESVVVGAYLDDDLGNGAGAVYVFRRSLLGGWTQLQKITATDGGNTDNFGINVAIDGSTMIIGAYLDDPNGQESGSAYVYDFSGGSWTQTQKLSAPDGASGDLFGRFVDIDGDRIVVGAPRHDGAAENTGAAYTFTLLGDDWIMTKKLDSTDPGFAEEFGHDVAIDGDTALVGAWREEDVSQTGAAYLYDLLMFECPGDLNFDDMIDTSDLGILIAAFGTDDGVADINGDGIVDTADLGLLISVFGSSCTP